MASAPAPNAKDKRVAASRLATATLPVSASHLLEEVFITDSVVKMLYAVVLLHARMTLIARGGIAPVISALLRLVALHRLSLSRVSV
jgi:hypothetical protein